MLLVHYIHEVETMCLKEEPAKQYAMYGTLIEKSMPELKVFYDNCQQHLKKPTVAKEIEKNYEKLLNLVDKLKEAVQSEAVKKDALRCLQHTAVVYNYIISYHEKTSLIFMKYKVTKELNGGIASDLLYSALETNIANWPLSMKLSPKKLAYWSAKTTFTENQIQALADEICLQISKQAKKQKSFAGEENTLVCLKFAQCFYTPESSQNTTEFKENDAWWEKVYNLRDGLLNFLIMLHSIKTSSDKHTSYNVNIGNGLALVLMPEQLAKYVLSLDVTSGLIPEGKMHLVENIEEKDKELLLMLFQTNISLFKNNLGNLLKIAKALR